jgi:HK97 gp10 family phage protein
LATISIKGVDRLTQRFNKIANMELRDTVNEATKLVHGQAKDLAPVNKNGGGGFLAGSIHMQVKDTGKELQGRVYTNKEYAPYVEFGTGVTGNGTYPYQVEGLNLEYKNKGWAYFDEDKGEWIYTKGQKAQPYMYPALNIHKKTIKRIFKNGVKTKLKQNCKGGQ